MSSADGEWVLWKVSFLVSEGELTACIYSDGGIGDRD